MKVFSTFIIIKFIEIATQFMNIYIFHRESLQPCWILERGNNSLHLQVILETVFPLFPSDSAHLVSAKWNRGIKDVEAVNPDRAHSQSSHQSICSVEILGENSCSKTIPAVVGPLDNLVEVPDIRKNRQISRCIYFTMS